MSEDPRSDRPDARLSATPSSLHMHQDMRGGAEFDTIRRLIDRWGDLAHGIGDDAAVLVPGIAGARIVISTDASVEGVHFQREWLTAFEVGARGATAALSDLAAMGASASSVLVSLAVPDAWREHLDQVADGIGASVRAAGARIIGGNISRAACFSITFTVIGEAIHPVPRSGASPGDLLLVTGVLGGPADALRTWKEGREPSEWSRSRFVSPTARLREGAWLAKKGATSMIDISDGIYADASHLAAASKVTLTLDLDRLPVGQSIPATVVAGSGEEYELLCTMAPPDAESAAREFSERFGIPLTVVGSVGARQAEGSVVLRNEGVFAETEGLEARNRVEFEGGHDHFSR